MTTATSNNLESTNIHSADGHLGLDELKPDVSMKLEHMRHYLELADQQHGFLHDYVEDSGRDISNGIGWLLDDVMNILADVHNTLYPGDKLLHEGVHTEAATS